jgi:hypothetical protein
MYYVCRYVCSCTCIYIYVYVCMYVCTYVRDPFSCFIPVILSTLVFLKESMDAAFCDSGDFFANINIYSTGSDVFKHELLK